MNDNKVQEDIGIVTNIKNRIATVEIQKGGGCKSCSVSGICGGNDKTVTHKIQTELELQVGDKVRLFVSSGVKLFSSFIVFIFPILTMIIFYLLGKYILSFSENISILFSVTGILISGILIYIIDKKYANKLHFEIEEKIDN
jgi:positive regulator of sigma E activity